MGFDSTPCWACERHYTVNPFFSAPYSKKIVNMGLFPLDEAGTSAAAVLDNLGNKLFQKFGSHQPLRLNVPICSDHTKFSPV